MTAVLYVLKQGGHRPPPVGDAPLVSKRTVYNLYYSPASINAGNCNVARNLLSFKVAKDLYSNILVTWRDKVPRMVMIIVCRLWSTAT